MIQFISILVIAALNFSKSDFFKVMESGSESGVVALEKKIAQSTVSDDQRAYYGAIVMKSSEYQKTAGEKLKKFKEGKLLLENVIQNNPYNPEYRFLRLMIQENAPKLLKYNTHIQEDTRFIKENIGKVSKEIKSAILNYAEMSENLRI